VIFSRGRGGSGRHARGPGRHTRSGRQHTDPQDASGDEDIPEESLQGPYDISEAPSGVQRLDLGSLQVPAVQEVEVRVQANPDGAIQQVVLVHGDNALQLGVFAAPRSEGIWDEVREEIRTSLTNEGATTQEVDGEYGVELRARVNTPDGPADLRFVGVDGPRWMVRGVYQGDAATDPAAAGPLAECLYGLVIDRGEEAKPVREPLPLRLPREVADQAGQEGAMEPGAAGVGPDGSDGGPPATPRLNGTAPGQPGPRERPSPRPRGSA
jgi:hypothetical protein